MKKTQLLNITSNIALVLNVIAGALGYLWWLVIPVFALIHIVVRLSFISAEEAQNAQTQAPKTMIAPPQVRKFASILTGIILAGLTYSIGYAVSLLLGKIA